MKKNDKNKSGSKPMKFLVIRFRQMGDAVLATSLLNAIKDNFPDAEVHFVLNEVIAPLFANHPSVDRVVTFSNNERHKSLIYLAKIWRLMRRERYDVIIDMRSTVNTLPFSLFSPCSRFRIGLRKPYTRMAFNYLISPCSPFTSVVEHDVHMLTPLQVVKPLKLDASISLHITDDERIDYSSYLAAQGIDTAKPLLLCGVVSKLAFKCWPREFMVEVLRRIMYAFPQLQLVFNYAPGYEAESAHNIYKELGEPLQVFIDVQAPSMRQLVALASCSTAYFGNEGGARHIVQSVGVPSLVVVSPNVSKYNWLPKSDIEAVGIAPADVLSPDLLETLSYDERYRAVTPDIVWRQLRPFLERVIEKWYAARR